MKRLSLFIYAIFPLVVNAQLLTETDGFKWESFYEYGYVGAKNAKGKVIIPSLYDKIEYLNGCLIATSRNRTKTIFSTKGKNLMHGIKDVRFVDINKEEGSIFILKLLNQRRAAIRNNGDLIIPEHKYSYLAFEGDKTNGFFLKCHLDGNVGVFNTDGKKIIEPSKFQHVKRIYYKGKNFFLCNSRNINGYHCVIDENGKEIFKSRYFLSGIDESDGCFEICSDFLKNSKKGKIDLKGNIISTPSPVFEGIVPNYFKDGYGLIQTKEGKRGICGVNGDVIVPAKYDDVAYFYFWNYFGVYNGTKEGVYDKSGRCIIEADQYTDISYVEGLYKAEKDGYVRLFDQNGKELLTGSHNDVGYFKMERHGEYYYARSASNSKVALFDKEGKQMTPYKYTSVGMGFLNFVDVFINDKVGICDMKGREIVPPLFSDVTTLIPNKFFKVKNGNKVGICSSEGVVIVPFESFTSVNLVGNTFIAKNGARICKFSLTGQVLSDNQQNIELDKYIKLADTEFEEEHYRKAAEYYKKAIDIKPSASLFFNVGVSYYNNKNYNSSVDYFIKCLENDPSKHLIDRSRSLIAKARQLQAEKNERRQQMVSGIFGLVLGVANVYIQNQYNHSKMTNSGNTYRNQDMDYLLDPAFTINQVQTQNWTEYMRDTNGGKTMSYDEWYAKIKTPAIQAAKKGGDSDVSYSNSSTETYSSNNNVSNVSSSCRFCQGCGRCGSCNGKGYYYNPYDLSKTVTCTNCKNHNGICVHCNGTGKKI